jgi:hypothetical protein
MKAAAVADRIAAAMAGGSAPAGKKSCGAADAFGWMGGLEGEARTPPPDRRMSRIAPQRPLSRDGGNRPSCWGHSPSRKIGAYGQFSSWQISKTSARVQSAYRI